VDSLTCPNIYTHGLSQRVQQYPKRCYHPLRWLNLSTPAANRTRISPVAGAYSTIRPPECFRYDIAGAMMTLNKVFRICTTPIFCCRSPIDYPDFRFRFDELSYGACSLNLRGKVNREVCLSSLRIYCRVAFGIEMAFERPC
jgi:hypothetical protein